MGNLKQARQQGAETLRRRSVVEPTPSQHDLWKAEAEMLAREETEIRR